MWKMPLNIRKYFEREKTMNWCEENKYLKIPYNMKRENHAELIKKEGISYFEFPMFREISFLKQAFSTREGGVSEGYLGSMNLSYSRGDEPEHVDENFRRICAAIGVETESLVLSDQVHDILVQRVGKEDCQGKDLREKKLVGIDGLITNEKGVTLCTSYADCVPLYFVDKEHKAIGHTHSGWRGTVGKIGAVTIQKMKEEFATNPEDLVVAIGPSICQSCYEVSQDVADAFKGFVHPEEIAKKHGLSLEEVNNRIEAVCVSTGEEKYHLDLWLANKLIFMEAGVKEQNISTACVCTCCNSKLLFSHRATHGKRGNLAGFFCIN